MSNLSDYDYPQLHDPVWLESRRKMDDRQIQNKLRKVHSRNSRHNQLKELQRLTALRGRILDYCDRARTGSYHRAKEVPLHFDFLRMDYSKF